MTKISNLILPFILSIGLFATSCKNKPDLPFLYKKEKPGTETPPGTMPTPGSENQNPGMDPNQPPPEPELPDTAAEELHNQVLAGIKAKHAGAENQTWFSSRSQLNDNWLADSPKTYWDIDPSKLPKGFACKLGNIGCDIVFERKLCNTDADCSESNTQCLELFASVAHPSQKPKKMCLGSGDKVIDDYYSTMVKAEKHLELSSLTLPSGRFYQAMINALSFLSHKNESTGVRILISSVSGLVPENLTKKPSEVLNGITMHIVKAGGDTGKLRMNLAYLYSIRKFSWNHTKIVVADSNHVLQGGHNFLDPDYVNERPIFDLSMHASGSVGIGTQKFIDLMWKHADPVASNLDKNERVMPPPVEDPNQGKSLTIGMGRMGFFGDDASDEGFRVLLKTAKKSIFLAQQDLYNNIDTIGTPQASHALPELVDAILRGVHVKVAQSSSTKFLGYGTVSPEEASKLLLKAVLKEALARKFVPPDNLSLGEFLCQKLEYAPFLFSTKVREWPADPSNSKEKATDRAIGVHPKLIIVDETGFYLGSQNFYPSDLQEFGLFISDTKVTKQLLDQYWNKIWVNSSKYKMPCR